MEEGRGGGDNVVIIAPGEATSNSNEAVGFPEICTEFNTTYLYLLVEKAPQFVLDHSDLHVLALVLHLLLHSLQKLIVIEHMLGLMVPPLGFC